MDATIASQISQKADRLLRLARVMEPSITTKLKSIEHPESFPRLVGLDHRFKSKARIVEKATKKVVRENMTPDEAVDDIHDSLRYTFCLDQDAFKEQYDEVRAELSKCGLTFAEVSNTFPLQGDLVFYRGLNCTVRTKSPIRTRSRRGAKTSSPFFFELQFHTPESFRVKQETHASYELRRTGCGDEIDASQLAFERELVNGIPLPNRADEISDEPFTKYPQKRTPV